MVPSGRLGRIRSAMAFMVIDPDCKPPEKLARSIEAARKANPDGIAILAASSIDREKLSPAIEAAFRR